MGRRNRKRPVRFRGLSRSTKGGEATGMNYTLVLIWLGGLAAGCFLVATEHQYFAIFVFVMTFFLSVTNLRVTRQPEYPESPAQKPSGSPNALNVNRPEGIM